MRDMVVSGEPVWALPCVCVGVWDIGIDCHSNGNDEKIFLLDVESSQWGPLLKASNGG